MNKTIYEKKNNCTVQSKKETKKFLNDLIGKSAFILFSDIIAENARAEKTRIQTYKDDKFGSIQLVFVRAGIKANSICISEFIQMIREKGIDPASMYIKKPVFDGFTLLTHSIKK